MLLDDEILSDCCDLLILVTIGAENWALVVLLMFGCVLVCALVLLESANDV